MFPFALQVFFFTATCTLDILSIFTGNKFRDKITCLNSNCIKGRVQIRIFAKTMENKQNQSQKDVIPALDGT